jgi:hypothetical protein
VAVALVIVVAAGQLIPEEMVVAQPVLVVRAVVALLWQVAQQHLQVVGQAMIVVDAATAAPQEL